MLDEGGQPRSWKRRRAWPAGAQGRPREGDAHDGVGAGGEDVQLAVLDQLAVGAGDVREGEAQALGLADPVFLHQAHALGPAGRSFCTAPAQFVGVVGDAQVGSRDLALFNGRAGTQPRPSMTCSLASTVWSTGSQLTIWVLRWPRPFRASSGTATGSICRRIAGAHLARPVDRQTHRLHLLLHMSDVVVGIPQPAAPWT